jgi:hypothetical protein
VAAKQIVFRNIIEFDEVALELVRREQMKSIGIDMFLCDQAMMLSSWAILLEAMRRFCDLALTTANKWKSIGER